jgi:hypothetical protein
MPDNMRLKCQAISMDQLQVSMYYAWRFFYDTSQEGMDNMHDGDDGEGVENDHDDDHHGRRRLSEIEGDEEDTDDIVFANAHSE